jgi:hypothetical protein
MRMKFIDLLNVRRQQVNLRVTQSDHVLYKPAKNHTGVMIHLKINSIVQPPAALVK